ncbi:peptidoglycan-associated lipoprotein Pal [Guyparkeria hydrothermalis]|uniref:peptidoglycan-associated lipoprotein Pal n=1 Tax=Guyparkeria hydrothermalis TaxID=923 RepID=UPI00201FB57E|nr:peptidoglycan-associated lipoprotein Pal [Guyparkeria hydrothermalis]MCL7743820.1 peptidoglycan-associated lipoprotein Pal [Guyparkeria hydrothermalis]
MRWSYLASVGALAVVLSACSSTPEKGAEGGAAGANGAQSAGMANGAGMSESRMYEGQPAERQRIVYFGFDEYSVAARYQSMLEANADFLKANGNREVVIEGHTDERGSREYNVALGEKRANAVRDILLSYGVSSSQVETVSYGEERPAVEGTGERAWSQNRRAVIEYGQ